MASYSARVHIEVEPAGPNRHDRRDATLKVHVEVEDVGLDTSAHAVVAALKTAYEQAEAAVASAALNQEQGQ